MSKKLTAKQEAFCTAYVTGRTVDGVLINKDGKALSLADAYRSAYDTTNMAPATVRKEAAVLFSNPLVTTTCQQISDDMKRKVTVMTVSDSDRVLTKLRDLLDNAQGTPAENTMLRAADLLGKSCNMYSNTTVVLTEDKTARDISAEIERRLAEIEGSSGRVH